MFEQVGGFDEGFFLYFEEIDLCKRVRNAGWKVAYEPRTAVVHLEGQTTGVQGSRPRPGYWYASRRRFFMKHRGASALVAADALWLAGRLVGHVRGRAGDGCEWSMLWRSDRTEFLGGRRRCIRRS